MGGMDIEASAQPNLTSGWTEKADIISGISTGALLYYQRRRIEYFQRAGDIQPECVLIDDEIDILLHLLLLDCL